MSEKTKPTDESVAEREGEPSSSCNALLGSIRFMVLTGTDNEPWICRMKLSYVSPKGKSFHFEALDTASPYTYKCNAGSWPSETIEDAIWTYQSRQMGWFMGRDIPAKQRLERILAAQKLLEEKPDWEDGPIVDPSA